MKFPETVSLSETIEYVDGVIAALLALPELEALAASAGWDGFLQKLLEAQQARQLDQRALVRAMARTDVRDERWDNALTALSSETFHVSGKDADAKPYSLLFRAVPARIAASFGGDRAGSYGDELLQKAAAVNHPGLKAPLEAFAAANRTLKEAVAARTAARRALRLHEVRRSELIDDLQGLIDRTEVRILDLFPGNKALVRAVLGIKRSRRRDEEEAPAQEDGQPAAPA